MKPFMTCTGLAALIACGGPQGTQADDMSADEHEAHAASHDQEAGEHGEESEGGATPIGSGSPALAQFGIDIYNPTTFHSADAAEHHAIAEEHRRAAAELRAFEEEECGSFPAETRASCPLLGQLASVEDVPGGVRLQFKDEVNSDAAHAHVRCHNAFARTRGRDGMDHCPMYVDGVRVERDDDGSTLLLVEGDAAVGEVRTTARAHADD